MSTATGSHSITSTQIAFLDSLTDSTTSILGLISAFKIQRVAIWVFPDSTGAIANCSLIWISQGSSTTSQTSIQTITDSGGTVGSACISAVPPHGSQASLWTNAADLTDTLLFNFSLAGAEAIVDLDLLFAPKYAAGAMGTVTGATAGNRVFAALDSDQATPTVLSVASAAFNGQIS
jgi:hypothetical protein